MSNLQEHHHHLFITRFRLGKNCHGRRTYRSHCSELDVTCICLASSLPHLAYILTMSIPTLRRLHKRTAFLTLLRCRVFSGSILCSYCSFCLEIIEDNAMLIFSCPLRHCLFSRSLNCSVRYCIMHQASGALKKHQGQQQ